ncbi:MAG TPA: MotA/TolQ/ExbB proton channel family protein [Tepidisphaeraceae bacterium]|jgi:biopolymer transport protein ExbB|nr:MotA/TolQ/ExbB proton channel family protein [Tepidisphaeraceae bacterium]
MRRFALSKARLALLVVLMAGGAWATTAYAQDANAAPGAGGTTTVVKEQKTFFSVILDNKDDPIFWAIMILSVAGMALIIQGFMQNRPSVLMPDAITEQIREMISQKKFKELIEFTENDPSFISRALNPALKRAPSFSSMKEAMETALGEQTAEQFRKIEYLNIIGNLGPLLGLMGTVVGMIIAFLAMYNNGNATPGELAGGISKALTHTFLGLMLAVPCLACFGVLRTIVDRLTVRGALIAEELLLMVKPAEAKPVAARAPGAVPQPAPARKAPPMPVPSPSVG